MKKLVLSLVLGMAATVAFGQGTVSLSTATANAYAKFSNTVSSTFFTASSVPTLSVGLYAASDAATLSSGGGSLYGGTTLATLNAGGFVNSTTGGGNKTDASRAGLQTYFQIRAWSGGYATYELAKDSGLGSVFISTGSPIVAATPTADSLALVPTVQWNPGSTGAAGSIAIAMVPVPEPSVIALGVLGLVGALFIRRRK